MNIIYLLANFIEPTQLDIPKSDLGDSSIRHILQLITGIIGAISFLLMVLAGLKYVLSRGNPDEINKSKDTIIYALVGLLISMAALGIVTFVMVRV